MAGLSSPLRDMARTAWGQAAGQLGRKREGKRKSGWGASDLEIETGARWRQFCSALTPEEKYLIGCWR